MMGMPLLAVDITDLLTALVPIIFFVIYVINQLLTAKVNPQQQQQRNRQPPARNPQRRPQQQPPAERAMQRPRRTPAQGGASQLNDEIEQFLKRANQRRSERTPQQAAQPQRLARRAPEPVEVTPVPDVEEPIDVEPVDREFSTVAQSVAAHIGGRHFREHLAEDISQADERMERHLHQAFDHRLGTLDRGRSSSESSPYSEAADLKKTPAADLAKLLGTPQGIRQAIILGEILARPEHRW